MRLSSPSTLFVVVVALSLFFSGAQGPTGAKPHRAAFGAQKQGGGGGNGGGAAGAAAWDDSLLYTPEGQAHLAWQRMPAEQLAPKTREAQDFLFRKQFPATCEGKKFLVSKGNEGGGLGSHLHISSVHFGISVELGRIFLWSASVAAVYTDEETCGATRNIECFLRSPSNCSLQDAYAPGADTIEVEHGLAGNPFKLPYVFVPGPMANLWRRSGTYVKPSELKYWWRGQSVAFISRFNDAATAIMRGLRTNASNVLLGAIGAALPDTPPVTATQEQLQLAKNFPFARGTVSIHVRHGDKGIEMVLVKDKTYFDAAEALVANNPMRYTRSSFISTEDPGTLESAKAETRDWSFLWYDVPRINSNGLDQINKISISRGLLSHIWFLQLLMALECDAWVGTRGSNWNRLIDELRCVWVPKCFMEYVEVGDPHDYENYGW